MSSFFFCSLCSLSTFFLHVQSFCSMRLVEHSVDFRGKQVGLGIFKREAKPGKLDIERREPGILADSLFELAIMT